MHTRKLFSLIALLAATLFSTSAVQAADTPLNEEGWLRTGGVLCKKHKILYELMDYSREAAREDYISTLNRLAQQRRCDRAPEPVPVIIQGYVRGYPEEMAIMQVDLPGPNDLPPMYIVANHLRRNSSGAPTPPSQEELDKAREEARKKYRDLY